MQKTNKKKTCFTAWNGENTKIHTHFQGAKSVFKTIGALVTPTAINPKTASKVLLSTKQGHRSTTHQGIPTRYFLKPTHTEPQNLLGESCYNICWMFGEGIGDVPLFQIYKKIAKNGAR